MAMSRFDYVKYDAMSMEDSETAKKAFQDVEHVIGFLPQGRYRALALTALEEAFMWVGKGIRDRQLDNTKYALSEDSKLSVSATT